MAQIFILSVRDDEEEDENEEDEDLFIKPAR
jgi:hypothetical protein